MKSAVLLVLWLCLAYVNALCKNQPNGVYVADPENCSRYYQCANGAGILKQCEKDYLWKDENKWCDFPYNVDCGSRFNPHPPPPSVCSGLDNVLLPDYQDCSKYYLCAKGYAVHKKCDGNYLWNDIMKWCDFPENVECAKPPGTTSAPVPTEPGTKPPQTNPPETTSKPTTSKPTQPGACTEEGKLYPNPTDCGSFYQCIGGKQIKQNCPAGLHFSPTTLVCDYPENAGCEVN